jgi:hypothetical protein
MPGFFLNELVVFTSNYSNPVHKIKLYFCDPNLGTLRKTVTYNAPTFGYEPVIAVFH